MNNNYYTTISRDEFINLYKFGSINVNTSFIILNSNHIENEIIELLNIMPWSQDEDYLIIEFKDDYCCIGDTFELIKTIYNLRIRDIKNIFTLSKRAQQFYSTKFDKRINFKLTPYKDIINKVNQFSEIKDIDNGINILFEQYNITNKEEMKLYFDNNFITDFLYTDNYLEINFKNIYLDILFYKRENKFVKDDIGYIFDFMIVTLLKERKNDVINKFKQGELRLNNSATYNELNKNKQYTLYEHISFLAQSNNENIQKFIQKTNLTSLIVSVIFFKIKYLLLNKFIGYKEEINQLINSFKTKYPKELALTLYLIGLVFGYKKLYDDYYDFLQLDIFYTKNKIDSSTISTNMKKENPLDTVINHSNISEHKQTTTSLVVNQLTNEEVKKVSLSKLKKMAKEAGYTTGLSKYRSTPEDKIKLYNNMKKHNNIFQM